MARRGNPNWSKGKSGNPSGKPRASKFNVDGWHNILSGLGTSAYDKTTSGAFCADVVTFDMAQDLWRGDDLAARAIETWPNEMLRRGFELQVTSDDTTLADVKPKPGEEDGDDQEAAKAGMSAAGKDGKLPPKGKKPSPFGKTDGMRRDAADGKKDQEKVADHWKEIGLVAALWKALAYERSYGGAAILLGVNDGQDLRQPLDLEKVIDFTFLTVLTPREIQPIAYYANPRAPKYGQAALYQLTPITPGTPIEKTFSPMSVQIHESRLIVFEGIKVDNTQMTGTLAGWGDSILTRVYRVLRGFNMSWQSAEVLLHDFAQAVYGVKGLAEMIAGDKDDEIITRMKVAERARSSSRAIMIDSEETFERKQTPVSGLPELLQMQCQRLAAAFDMPLTLLMGTSPGGLNATGESDIILFYNRVESAQHQKLTDPIERVTRLTYRALKIKEPEAWTVCYKPLRQPTTKETAEAREIQSRTDERYIASGVLSPEEIAVSRFGGDEYSFETMVDFEARAMMQPVAEAPAKTTQQIETEEREAEEKAAQFELDKTKVQGAAKPKAKE